MYIVPCGVVSSFIPSDQSASKSSTTKPLPRAAEPPSREVLERRVATLEAQLKSLRGSDADAALYYLSRMIRGGEDPRFIVRRLMVCAAEDVGNADAQAFILAETAARAVERIGWPEARIPLAQAVIYVANAPKSNATIAAIDAALGAEDHPVPASLRDAHTAVSRTAGRGQGYFYSHQDYGRRQDFLPEALRGQRFHEPVRPQERNWLDRAEPDLAGYGLLRSVRPDDGYEPVHRELRPAAAERVGGGAVGAGKRVQAVDLLHHVGRGDVELHRRRLRRDTCTLQHRAHRAIEHEHIAAEPQTDIRHRPPPSACR